MGSSINLQTARAMQEAARYKSAAGILLFFSGLAAVTGFLVEMKSYFVFNDWLQAQLWTEHEFLRGIVGWFTEAFPDVFTVFGLLGVASLFMKDDLAKVIRFIFLVFALPMLLLPVLRRDSERLLLIALCIAGYFVFRSVSQYLANQRPRDWKTVLLEKKRLGLGPEEFARALVNGIASDGHKLALFVAPGADLPEQHEIRTQVHELLGREAYGELGAILPPKYEPFTTLLRLRLKQRFPRAFDPIKCLERDGASESELAMLRNTLFYVHPEIANRLRRVLEN